MDEVKGTKMRSITAMTGGEIRQELSYYEKQFGFKRPSRSAIDPNRPWQRGTPNYDVADLLFFRGRSKKHAEGSLEGIVEDAVKAWESEASHLLFKDWRTVQHDVYKISANGGRTFKGDEAAQAGNYNVLLDGVDDILYNSKEESFLSSHRLFGDAFQGGFPWELLQVFSPPPKIAFSWRHWGTFTGEYKRRRGDGKVYDLLGFGILVVNDKLKVQSIEIFYKPEDFLKALQGDLPPEALHAGATVLGSGCPFVSRKK